MNDATTRHPGQRPPAGLNDLSVLPVFFKLTGKRVLVAGGSDAAAWKAELLAACGAQTYVCAANIGSKLKDLSARTQLVQLIPRAVIEADFVDVALAIGDFEHSEEIEAFRAMARKAGVICNVIDKPQQSDFQFGSLVERSPLVIAISTDGAAPVFGQALRMRLETLLPDGLRHWAQAAKNWRPKISALNLDFHARRKVWEIFAKRALAHPETKPGDEDFASMLAALEQPDLTTGTGHVALVGAGPGDPELLTLKAVRALQSADVVLFDDLVAPGVVDMARREALRVSVGKRGYKPSCTQEDIISLLLDHAKAGRRVVRLKGGDPSIFGRAGEEIAALQQAGISVEIIPGVTSASAAAASLKRSLTERETARRVQMITAHARNGQLPDDLDWRALADRKATTIVYMGVRTLQALADRLCAEGLDPDTPAVIIERASWPEERHIRSTIAKLPQAAEAAAIQSPSLVMIGHALRDPQDEQA